LVGEYLEVVYKYALILIDAQWFGYLYGVLNRQVVSLLLQDLNEILLKLQQDTV
jgi:hypothetical protein